MKEATRVSKQLTARRTLFGPPALGRWHHASNIRPALAAFVVEPGTQLAEDEHRFTTDFHAYEEAIRERYDIRGCHHIHLFIAAYGLTECPSLAPNLAHAMDSVRGKKQRINYPVRELVFPSAAHYIR